MFLNSGQLPPKQPIEYDISDYISFMLCAVVSLFLVVLEQEVQKERSLLLSTPEREKSPI